MTSGSEGRPGRLELGDDRGLQLVPDRERMTLRLPEHDMRRLRIEAAVRGVPANRVVTEALDCYFNSK
jgi:predicted DNA binding CopG/RHH family protein